MIIVIIMIIVILWDMMILGDFRILGMLLNLGVLAERSYVTPSHAAEVNFSNSNFLKPWYWPE